MTRDKTIGFCSLASGGDSGLLSFLSISGTGTNVPLALLLSIFTSVKGSAQSNEESNEEDEL